MIKIAKQSVKICKNLKRIAKIRKISEKIHKMWKIRKKYEKFEKLENIEKLNVDIIKKGRSKISRGSAGSPYARQVDIIFFDGGVWPYATHVRSSRTDEFRHFPLKFNTTTDASNRQKPRVLSQCVSLCVFFQHVGMCVCCFRSYNNQVTRMGFLIHIVLLLSVVSST